MAQFFFFSSLDLNIDFVFRLGDKSIEVFEVDVDFLLKPITERQKGFLDRIDIGGGDFHGGVVYCLTWLLSSP